MEGLIHPFPAAPSFWALICAWSLLGESLESCIFFEAPKFETKHQLGGAFNDVLSLILEEMI